ncbi:hypothetical protein CSQ79_17630 [Gloeocapsopsis sp. IPPAS B-1203]|nr:hypothetical protein CSQ79_17630 [Gloeocapsopsis sp. IPPAS B-1203]
MFRCLLQHINSIIAQNNLQQVAQRFAGELSDNELPLPQIPWMVKLDGSYIYFFQFKQTG